jgi:hypothetical protein
MNHDTALADALLDAEDMDSSNRALALLAEELQDEREQLIAEHRSSAVVLLIVALAAGYIAGLLHAGLQP